MWVLLILILGWCIWVWSTLSVPPSVGKETTAMGRKSKRHKHRINNRTMALVPAPVMDALPATTTAPVNHSPHSWENDYEDSFAWNPNRIISMPQQTESISQFDIDLTTWLAENSPDPVLSTDSLTPKHVHWKEMNHDATKEPQEKKAQNTNPGP